MSKKATIIENNSLSASKPDYHGDKTKSTSIYSLTWHQQTYFEVACIEKNSYLVEVKKSFVRGKLIQYSLTANSLDSPCVYYWNSGKVDSFDNASVLQFQKNREWERNEYPDIKGNEMVICQDDGLQRECIEIEEALHQGNYEIIQGSQSLLIDVSLNSEEMKWFELKKGLSPDDSRRNSLIIHASSIDSPKRRIVWAQDDKLPSHGKKIVFRVEDLHDPHCTLIDQARTKKDLWDRLLTFEKFQKKRKDLRKRFYSSGSNDFSSEVPHHSKAKHKASEKIKKHNDHNESKQFTNEYQAHLQETHSPQARSQETHSPQAHLQETHSPQTHSPIHKESPHRWDSRSNEKFTFQADEKETSKQNRSCTQSVQTEIDEQGVVSTSLSQGVLSTRLSQQLQDMHTSVQLKVTQSEKNLKYSTLSNFPLRESNDFKSYSNQSTTESHIERLRNSKEKTMDHGQDNGSFKKDHQVSTNQNIIEENTFPYSEIVDQIFRDQESIQEMLSHLKTYTD